jgi:HSP20 family protein
MTTALLAPGIEKKTPAPRRAMDVSRYLEEEVDRVLNDFGLRTQWPFAPTVLRKDEAIWAPDLEVEEKGGMLHMRVDLPGMKREDVTVEIAEGMLTVQGERKREEERKEKGYYRTERSYGRFSRSITLPDGARLDSAKATFANGVLEIMMSVKEAETPAVRQLVIG